MKTKREVAVEAGLQTFDCALPQYWIDRVAAGTPATTPADAYSILLAGVVWCYDRDPIWGHPAPITPEARELLDRVGEVHFFLTEEEVNRVLFGEGA